MIDGKIPGKKFQECSDHSYFLIVGKMMILFNEFNVNSSI